jgi:hypothetical protein
MLDMWICIPIMGGELCMFVFDEEDDDDVVVV